MKRQLVFVLCFCIFLAFAGSVSADEELANPSFYSAGEMVMDIPGYWIANYIEIQEYLKKYFQIFSLMIIQMNLANFL